MKIIRKLKSWGLDGFVGLLPVMVISAFILPGPGSADGAFSLKSIANYGISFIFFFYGLRLGYEKLKQGMSNWKLHAVVHLSTFILFPALILLVKPLFKGVDNELLWLGMFFLAALPSTVSSAVVMVSIAGGNVPAAIFDASVSSLAGVFVTPVLMALVMSTGGDFEYGELNSIIIKLVMQVLLPVALGMLLNKKWGGTAEKYKKQSRQFDQTVILLIVYTSFCESFAHGVFKGFGVTRLVLCAAGMVLLFFIVFGVINAACRYLKFNREDTITATYCGSKKSLVHGTAMSKVLFPGFASVGIILLPIMLYHVLQLLIISGMARKTGKVHEIDASGE